MGQKIFIGPMNKGLRNDVRPFYIDNDNFSNFINAYQWRGRAKRKRGTSLLGRLERHFDSTSYSYTPGGTLPYTITLDSSGNGNILSGTYGNGTTTFSLQTNGNIVPSSVTITDTVSSISYTDNGDGTMSPSGSINYASGAIMIAAAASHAVTAVFDYYPDLPVMGLEDWVITNYAYPGTIAFDTVYSYNIQTVSPYTIYDVSFYKNPSTNTYSGYTEKTDVTPTSWNSQTYQQVWTTNYQGALWATNGVTQPFNSTNIGMQFKPIVTVTVTSGGPPAVVNLSITAHGLVVGDFLFINEVATTTGINYQTGYVITVVDANTVTVKFPNATISSNGTGGIAQYLTNRSDPTKDCLRWYDGDPTTNSGTQLNGHLGWVNFAPPLSNLSYSIDDEPEGIYYLVGAKLIVPFKDRLIFFGPVIQTSTGSPLYLPDTLIFSQNGTPYYTASFTGDVTLATTTYSPILVPSGQTATPNSYFEDLNGYGGNLGSGLDQTIYTVGANEDVLIVGFSKSQARLVYTGNDLLPFNLFVINSELGSGSTFSSVTMDRGVLSQGSRGYLITSQVESRRIDLDIPDEVFQINLSSNGSQRVCAQRDYINEWIYFTFPSNELNAYTIYPNETLQFNYRDNTWSIFYETYTTYGLFRYQTGWTWSTIGTQYPTWADWNVPWNAGSSTSFTPQVIGGNSQGFVLVRNKGTSEANSLYIRNISGSTVTSPDHCLNTGDYIVISGCMGTVGSSVNGEIFSVNVTDANTFILNPSLSSGLTYIGGGLIQRMYVPFIQSKQFPVAWEMARKCRIGPQQYLFTRTSQGQITLLIFLSQNADTGYNNSAIVPSEESWNNSLVYSTVLYTSPEYYVQVCTNQSLGTIGNGVATSFTFNYPMLFSLDNAPLVPGSLYISVGSIATFTDNGSGGFTVTGTGDSGTSSINYYSGIVTIGFSVAPAATAATTNFNYYVPNIQSPTAMGQSEIWHRLNTSLLGDTVQFAFTLSDAQMRDTTFSNQFAEIEFHGAVIDVNPSSLLA